MLVVRFCGDACLFSVFTLTLDCAATRFTLCLHSGKQGGDLLRDLKGLDFSLSSTLTFKVPAELRDSYAEYCRRSSETVSAQLNRYMVRCLKHNGFLITSGSVPEGALAVSTIRVSPDVKREFSALCKREHISVASALRKFMASEISRN